MGCVYCVYCVYCVSLPGGARRGAASLWAQRSDFVGVFVRQKWPLLFMCGLQLLVIFILRKRYQYLSTKVVLV